MVMVKTQNHNPTTKMLFYQTTLNINDTMARFEAYLANNGMDAGKNAWLKQSIDSKWQSSIGRDENGVAVTVHKKNNHYI